MSRLTKAKIARYLELEEQAKALRRQASDLMTMQRELRDELMSHVKEHGGDGRTLAACGYILAILDEPNSVPWQKEFVKRHGEQLAEQLREEAGTKEVLNVQKV